jgi:phage I-like protein
MKLLIVGHGMVEAKQFACASMDLSNVAPSEIQLLLPGKWNGYMDPTVGKKSFEVKPSHIAAAIDYHQQRKSRSPQRDLVIDYEHQTLKGGEAPAAGWMANLEARDGKLFATGVTWTKKAQKHIEEGEYKYISPVFAFDVVDKVSGKIIPMAVFNAALTNEPFFDELQPIVSKDNSLSLFLFTTKENFMDELLQRLRYFLNLPITATADDCAGELTKLSDQLKSMMTDAVQAVNGPAILQFIKDMQTKVTTVSANYNDVVASLGLQAGATVDEVKGHIIAAKSNVTSLQSVTQELQQFKQERLTEKFNGVIAKGMQSGRITPAQKDDTNWLSAQQKWAESNFATFEEYFTTKAPVIVPLGQIQVNPIAGKGEGITTEDAIIAKQLGVTEDQLKKVNL